MVTRIGKNTNSATDATIVTHSVGSTTSVNIVDALLDGDPPHISVTVTNSGAEVLWIAKQDESVSNDKVSIPISPGTSKLIVGRSDVYRGAISAIFSEGGTQDVITEVF